MSKFKDILIDAEDALKKVQAELDDEATIEELKYHAKSRCFFAMAVADDGSDLYFVTEIDGRAVEIDASTYGLGVHGAIELTAEVPQILQTIAEE